MDYTTIWKHIDSLFRKKDSENGVVFLGMIHRANTCSEDRYYGNV